MINPVILVMEIYEFQEPLNPEVLRRLFGTRN